jgi:hypothetical protein
MQNDQFFVSHDHRTGDGLPNLEDQTKEEPVADDKASTSSVVRKSPNRGNLRKSPSVNFLSDVTVNSPLHSIAY